MRAVPYGFEMRENRAPHYWAIACATCPPDWPEFDDLKMVDGVLQCAWCRGEAKKRMWLNPAIIPADHPRIKDYAATNLESPRA